MDRNSPAAVLIWFPVRLCDRRDGSEPDGGVEGGSTSVLAFHGRISSLQPHFQHLPTLPLRLLFSQSLKDGDICYAICQILSCYFDDGTYAMKKVLIQNNEQLELVREEIRVSSSFSHRNLLPLLDHAIISVKPTQEGSWNHDAYLLFPVHLDGTLLDNFKAMSAKNDFFSTLDVLQIFLQLSFRGTTASEDGELYMWGKNSSGQLGLRKKAAKAVHKPTKVECLSGLTIKLAALGSEHTVVVTNGGEALSWGAVASGRLGHGLESSIFGFLTSNSEYTPRLIKKLEGIRVKRVAAGLLHSACIDGIAKTGSLFVFRDKVVANLDKSSTESLKSGDRDSV
ncbi:hypothetical protein PVK06_025707 [Gossypium arboreum]|uniref:Uncharacterized protein n=1 Tax=Gossypium arboreum TaxID=29729 RepID=A0ABR0NVL6_GOSAR|nr:hypothetical protein PVK06_025707 [Gossypium arboreum]